MTEEINARQRTEQTTSAVEPGQRANTGAASVSGRTESAESDFNRQDAVIGMLPFVRRVALKMRKHLPTHVEVDDLTSDGVLGLLDAVSKFDSSKRTKLESYAQHRVRGAILDGLRAADPASRDMRRKSKRIEKLYRELEGKVGRPVRDEEIASAAGMKLARWHRTLKGIQSLGFNSDSRVLSAGPTSKHLPEDPRLLTDCSENPFDFCYRREQRGILAEALSSLPERERQVISLHDQAGWTMKRIAVLMQVDESRVSQLHSAALARLKRRVGFVLRPPAAEVPVARLSDPNVTAARNERPPSVPGASAWTIASRFGNGTMPKEPSIGSAPTLRVSNPPRRTSRTAMKCVNCNNTIEEGRKDRPPVDAKFCIKCRSERRRRRRPKYVWLPQHDAYMRAHYHGGLHQRGRAIKELMRQSRFPRWFIKRQAQRLGLTMRPDRRPWTAQDLDTLDRLLCKVSAATIAKRLGRTETSVVMKIKALGHSRRVTEGYTIRDLELCLGEDHHKIQRWIANGWLGDGLHSTKQQNGSGHDIRRFREKDLLEFIRRHPQEIILGKVDQTWFLDLVLLHGSETNGFPVRDRVARGRLTKHASVSNGHVT